MPIEIFPIVRNAREWVQIPVSLRNLLVAGLGEVKVAIPEDSNENNV